MEIKKTEYTRIEQLEKELEEKNKQIDAITIKEQEEQARKQIQTGKETITKRQAAVEVMMREKAIFQIGVISLILLVLTAMIEGAYNLLPLMAGLTYLAFQIYNTKKRQQYLEQKYGT